MECKVCGGHEFDTEVGKQICLECGTQNEDYVEVILDEDAGTMSQGKVTRLRMLDMRNQEQQERDNRQRVFEKQMGKCSHWTTYEALTLILHDWSLMLVKLGAKSSLPQLLLQLWAGYLSKIEIAFLDAQHKKKKSAMKKPKVGLVRNKRDINILHLNDDSVSHVALSSLSHHRISKRTKVQAPNTRLEKLMRRVHSRHLTQNVRCLKGNASIATADLSRVLQAVEEKTNDSDKQSSSKGAVKVITSSGGSESVKTHEDPDHPIHDINKKRIYKAVFVKKWLERNQRNGSEMAALEMQSDEDVPLSMANQDINPIDKDERNNEDNIIKLGEDAFDEINNTNSTAEHDGDFYGGTFGKVSCTEKNVLRESPENEVSDEISNTRTKTTIGNGISSLGSQSVKPSSASCNKSSSSEEDITFGKMIDLSYLNENYNLTNKNPGNCKGDAIAIAHSLNNEETPINMDYASDVTSLDHGLNNRQVSIELHHATDAVSSDRRCKDKKASIITSDYVSEPSPFYSASPAIVNLQPIFSGGVNTTSADHMEFLRLHSNIDVSENLDTPSELQANSSNYSSSTNLGQFLQDRQSVYGEDVELTQPSPLLNISHIDGELLIMNEESNTSRTSPRSHLSRACSNSAVSYNVNNDEDFIGGFGFNDSDSDPDYQQPSQYSKSKRGNERWKTIKKSLIDLRRTKCSEELKGVNANGQKKRKLSLTQDNTGKKRKSGSIANWGKGQSKVNQISDNENVIEQDQHEQLQIGSESNDSFTEEEQLQLHQNEHICGLDTVQENNSTASQSVPEKEPESFLDRLTSYDKRMCNGEPRKASEHDRKNYRLLEPFMPTIQKLLALVYIACCINGEDILLFDLLRWCSSDHLPYSTSPYLLQDSIVSLSRYDLYMLYQCKNLPSHGTMRTLVGRLSLLLEVRMLPLPSTDVVISRLLHGLCLPDDMHAGASWLCRHLRGATPSTRRALDHYPAVEVAAAAAVLVLLKMMWCLDGRVERRLSQSVDRLNAELQSRGSSHRLFSWSRWHRHVSRIQWFNRTVDPGEQLRGDGSAPLNTHYCPQRLAQHYWTHGIWRRGRTTTASRDDLLLPLVHRSLSASSVGRTLDEALSEQRLFKASYKPLVGLAEQYVLCWKEDRGKDREQMKTVADEICSESFEKDQSNFLENLSSVQRKLKQLGSKLVLRIDSADSLLLPLMTAKLALNSFRGHNINTSNGYKDLKRCSVKTTGERSSIRQSVVNDSDCVLEDRGTNDTTTSSSRSRDCHSFVDVTSSAVTNRDGGCDDVHGGGKMDGEIVVLEAPFEKMWLHPRTARQGVRKAKIKEGDLVLKDLPHSYQWLVLLLARVCCADVDDLLWYVVTLEKYLVSKRKL